MANNNASKREIIFNYCYKDCGEISPTIINKIYNFNVDLNQIVNMDISEFTSLYGVRKQDLLDTLICVNLKLFNLCIIWIRFIFKYLKSIN